MEPFKWQNILERKCPKCGRKLLEKKARGEIYRNCEDDACAWGISESRIINILKDKNHPIHNYTTAHQEDLFAQL